MKVFPGKMLLHIAVVCLLFCLTTLMPSPAGADDTSRGLLVKLASGASIDDLNRAHGTWELCSVPDSNIHVVEPDDGRTQSALCAELCADPNVLSVESDTPISLKATRYHFSHDGGTGTYVNNNVFTQIGYGMFSQQLSGTGVVVAVLDTGAALNHPDLIGHFTTGYNFVNDTNDPSDVPDSSNNSNTDSAVGHGTFNAGIIAKMAPAAQIMPLKVLNGQGIGFLSDVISGIHWAVDHNASVINMSFSSSQPSHLLNEAIEYAHQAGVIMVAAAGNDPTGAPSYPAACRYVLGVASVNADDTLSSFSDYGNFVSLMAPGKGIRSAFWDGTYAIGDGTSFAAPFATGLATLLLSANSTPTQPYGGLPPTPNTVVQKIENSAFSIDYLNPTYAGLLGYGMINCDGAVLKLLYGL